MLRNLLVVLALITMMVPLASGQTDPFTEIETDNAQDVTLNAADSQTTTVPSGLYDSTDLVSLNIGEDNGNFIFVVEVVDIPDDDNSNNVFIGTRFDHRDISYRVEIYKFSGFGGGNFYSRLSSYDEGQERWQYRSTLQVVVDRAEDTMTVEVDRMDLPDSNGAAPFPGRVLENIAVRSEGFSSDSFNRFKFAPIPTAEIFDNMPNTGFSSKVFEVTMGVESSGGVSLYSFDPFRASNGEATTFIYDVTASNLEAEKDTFTIEALQVPPEWKVTLPVTAITLDLNESRSFPVLVTTPFTHDHGKVEQFVLELAGETDAKQIARLEMGIRYLEVPQPAGHHSKVYFHSEAIEPPFDVIAPTFGFGNIYMNTEEDYEPDSKLEVPADRRFDLQDNTFYWDIPLSPRLETGLDFDLAGMGELQLPVTTTVPLTGAVLSGQLVYFGGPSSNGEAIVLADLNATAPKDIDGDTAFTIQFTATAASDYLPYAQDSWLELQLELTTERPTAEFGPDGPSIRPGGWMQLPLIDYHDRVDGFANLLKGVVLKSSGPSERSVNPGETVIFPVTLENKGEAKRTFALTIQESGSNQAWAEILGAESMQLDAGEIREFSIAVNAPKGAVVPEIADITLQAVDEADPSALSVLRLVASVVTDVDLPDEGEDAQALRDGDSKKSPGLPIVFLLVALAALARRK